MGVSGLFSIPPLMAKFRGLVDGVGGLVDGFSALMRTVLAGASHMSMRYSLMATLQRIDR